MKYLEFPLPDGRYLILTNSREDYLELSVLAADSPFRVYKDEDRQDAWWTAHGEYSTRDEYPPELQEILKFQFADEDGLDRYYTALLYISGRDNNGLLEGEEKPQNVWLPSETIGVRYTEHRPEDVLVTYTRKVLKGKGRPIDLEAARKVAHWPDAKLEDITRENLAARLPALMLRMLDVCGKLFPEDVEHRMREKWTALAKEVIRD